MANQIRMHLDEMEQEPYLQGLDEALAPLHGRLIVGHGPILRARVLHLHRSNPTRTAMENKSNPGQSIEADRSACGILRKLGFRWGWISEVERESGGGVSRKVTQLRLELMREGENGGVFIRKTVFQSSCGAVVGHSGFVAL